MTTHNQPLSLQPTRQTNETTTQLQRSARMTQYCTDLHAKHAYIYAEHAESRKQRTIRIRNDAD